MEKTDKPYEDSERCSALAARLRELEHKNPKVFDMVETYIAGVYEGVKVTLGEVEKDKS